MTFGDLSRSAVANLGRRKVRTVLTSVGVIVGILTIVTMVSLGIGVRLEINKQFNQLGLENVFVRPPEGEQDFFTQFAPTSRPNPITPAHIERWKALPDVKELVTDIYLPLGVASGLQIGDKTVAIDVAGSGLANGPDRDPFEEPPTALAGTIDLPQTGGSAILTKDAVEALSIAPDQYANLIGQQAEIVLQSPRGERQAFPLQIVGISSESTGGPLVRVPVQDRIAMKSWWFNKPDILQTDGYDFVTIRANDLNGARTLVAQIKGEGFDVESIEIMLDLANKVFSVINVMLSSVGGLALLVASVGIVNTMIMSIYERTREIGTLKAIGASRGDIRLMFMLEAGLIGLMGGVIGIILGYLLGKLLNYGILWYIEREQLPVRGEFFVVTPWLALYTLLFATMIGIVAGLYPANRAAKLDPLTALRHE